MSIIGPLLRGLMVVWTHFLNFNLRAKELDPREKPGCACMCQGVPFNAWATRIRKNVAAWSSAKELKMWEMPGWAYMWQGPPVNIWATRIRRNVVHSSLNSCETKWVQAYKTRGPSTTQVLSTGGRVGPHLVCMPKLLFFDTFWSTLGTWYIVL